MTAIAVLGAGNIGATLAGKWATTGHRVTLGLAAPRHAAAPRPGSHQRRVLVQRLRRNSDRRCDVDCLGDHQAQLLGTPSANRWMECRSRSFLRCRYRRARARYPPYPAALRNLGFDVTIAPAAHITYRRKLSPDHR